MSDKKNEIKIKFSKFLLIFILFFIIICACGYYIFSLYNQICLKDDEIHVLKLENSNLENQISKQNFQIDELNTQISVYEKKINKLQVDSDLLDDVLNNIESDINGFTSGNYSYDYDVIMEEGEPSEWTLALSMGFTFRNDGTVYGILPGHESGSLFGTYEIYDKEIKCIFNEYENESSSTYGLKLEQSGELILNRVSDKELSISKWTKKPILDGSDLSYGDNKIFTINLIQK